MSMLKCGFARAKITPEPAHTYMDGYGFRVSPAEGVRDDLYVNICAITAGDRRFLIASFDLCGMSRRVYELVRGQISALTGLGAADMALCATHTHAGPACGVLDITPINYDYYLNIGSIAGAAAMKAFDSAVVGEFEYSIPGSLRLSMNRRGRNVIDPRIKTAVFVAEQDSRPRGAIASASCHAVINTTMLLSADYLSELNAYAQDGFPVLFLQGRGGDINPANPDGLSTDDLIARLGGELTDAVAHAVNSAGTVTQETCDSASEYGYVNLPMKPFPDAEALEGAVGAHNAAAAALDFGDLNRHFNLSELNWHNMALDCVSRGEKSLLRVPLQLLRLGCALFIFVPFELLTLTGDKLEAMAAAYGYAPERIFVQGYSNSLNGYLAPSEEFAYGGYEVSGASHWYRLPECIPETEATMLDWFAAALAKTEFNPPSAL